MNAGRGGSCGTCWPGLEKEKGTSGEGRGQVERGAEGARAGQAPGAPPGRRSGEAATHLRQLPELVGVQQ